MLCTAIILLVPLCGINRTGKGLLIWNGILFCYGIPPRSSASTSSLLESDSQGGKQQGHGQLVNFWSYLLAGLTDALAVFLVTAQIPPQKQLKGGRAVSGDNSSWWESHHGVEAAAWSDWSHGIHSQEAGRAECRDPLHFSFLFSPGHLMPTVRVRPLTSVNPAEEFPYRHIQRFVSIVILNLINLPIKINYDSWLNTKTRKWPHLLSLVHV